MAFCTEALADFDWPGPCWTLRLKNQEKERAGPLTCVMRDRVTRSGFAFGHFVVCWIGRPGAEQDLHGNED